MTIIFFYSLIFSPKELDKETFFASWLFQILRRTDNLKTQWLGNSK